jgi:hypothetical protein
VLHPFIATVENIHDSMLFISQWVGGNGALFLDEQKDDNSVRPYPPLLLERSEGQVVRYMIRWAYKFRWLR